jgi:hypothetical protein
MVSPGVAVVVADGMSSYWLAGILTVVAALIVTVLMLINDRAEEDETP